ncbi:hypothetical protein [uncultured Nostoc sp.]|uniref:hypothetical protein n=1 Tax=uncultured Nostoc sp. TaxID=340711 RepID=UPI002630E524|nr:hypothetical protein [uncultured Nostoc sp.]
MKKIFAKMATITATSAALSIAVATAANNPAQAVEFKFNWQGDVAMHRSFFLH